MLHIAKLLDLVYLHECALLAGSITADLHKSSTEEDLFAIKPVSGTRFSSSYVKSLSACLSNAYEMLDTFLSISIDDLRWQPIFQFARIVYALVVLVKVTLGTASKRAVGMEEMNDSYRRQTSNYINSIHERFELVADGDRCPSVAMFGGVIASLRSFFQRLASISGSQSWLNDSRSHGQSVPQSPPLSHEARHGTQSVMQSSHSDSRSNSGIDSGKNEFPPTTSADEHNGKQNATTYRDAAPTTTGPSLYSQTSHPSRPSSSIPTMAQTQAQSSLDDPQNTGSGSSRSSSNYISPSNPLDDSNWLPDLANHPLRQQFPPSTILAGPDVTSFTNLMNTNGGYEQLLLDDEMMWMLSQSNPIFFPFDDDGNGSGGGDIFSWP